MADEIDVVLQHDAANCGGLVGQHVAERLALWEKTAGQVDRLRYHKGAGAFAASNEPLLFLQIGGEFRTFLRQVHFRNFGKDAVVEALRDETNLKLLGSLPIELDLGRQEDISAFNQIRALLDARPRWQQDALGEAVRAGTDVGIFWKPDNALGIGM